MSESTIGLNTSKRKFYKLLDNLSSSKVQLPPDINNRNASTTTLAPQQEPPSKRFRFLGKDRPTTAPSTDKRPTTAGAKERPRSSIFSVNSSAKARPKSFVSEKDVGTVAPTKQANFAPWSHEQFLGRLKTFADLRGWTPKPPAIGEVEWAKRGWTVVAKDTVGCKGGCEKRLVVRVADGGKEEGRDDDDWWMGDVEREMAERYRGLIGEGHAEECLWRRKGCEDDIYRIKMTDPAVWQGELRERYLSLLAVEGSLPAKLDLKTEGDEEDKLIFNVDEIAAMVPANVLRRGKPANAQENDENSPPTPTEETSDTETPAKDINTTALSMALLGWTGQSQNNVRLAYCTKCFQRAGLWLYTPSPSSTTEELLFNPSTQHREYCPWANASTQCALGRLEGLAGWEVLIQLIRGHRRHDRPPRKKDPSRPQSVAGSEFFDDDGGEDGEARKTKEQQKEEDKERKGRLQKLRRAFTVKKSGDGGAKSRERQM